MSDKLDEALERLRYLPSTPLAGLTLSGANQLRDDVAALLEAGREDREQLSLIAQSLGKPDTCHVLSAVRVRLGEDRAEIKRLREQHSCLVCRAEAAEALLKQSQEEEGKAQAEARVTEAKLAEANKNNAALTGEAAHWHSEAGHINVALAAERAKTASLLDAWGVENAGLVDQLDAAEAKLAEAQAREARLVAHVIKVAQKNLAAERAKTAKLVEAAAPFATNPHPTMALEDLRAALAAAKASEEPRDRVARLIQEKPGASERIKRFLDDDSDGKGRASE